jgi:hypothetical protein
LTAMCAPWESTGQLYWKLIWIYELFNIHHMPL